jgi:hypothetical protein
LRLSNPTKGQNLRLQLWLLQTPSFVDKAIIFIFGIITVVAALTILRDELWRQGWLKTGWLAETARRSHVGHIKAVLSAIGFRSDHFETIRNALDQQRMARRLAQRPPNRDSLSLRLLSALKHLTYKLEQGFTNKEAGEYYVDTMGAMFNSGVGDEPLASLLEEWIERLISEGLIKGFDCILANKDGNVELAHRVCNRHSPTGETGFIACKGPRDSSRVQRDVKEPPHITDFEGLRFYLSRPELQAMDRKVRVLAVDDNCRGGKTLCNVIGQFNQWVRASGNAFEPVTDAVVLFVVKDPATQRTFSNAGVQLHALVSVGSAQMQQLIERNVSELSGKGFRFKEGYGCEASCKLKC